MPTDPAQTMSAESVVTAAPIPDEPGDDVPGPSNVRGTIGMGKIGPDTVTSQWFINRADNSFLDDPQRSDGDFSAFGVVLGDGMEVVDAIGTLPVPTAFGFSISAPFNNLPLRDFSGNSIAEIREIHTVVLHSVAVIPEPTTARLLTLGLAGLGMRRRG